MINVALFVPTTDPFTFHVKVGAVPPLVTVALNTFWLPTHCPFCVELIEIAAAVGEAHSIKMVCLNT